MGKFIHVMVHESGADISLGVLPSTCVTVYRLWHAKVRWTKRASVPEFEGWLESAEPGDAFSYGEGLFVASSGGERCA